MSHVSNTWHVTHETQGYQSHSAGQILIESVSCHNVTLLDHQWWWKILLRGKKGSYRFKLIWLDSGRLFLKTGENSWDINVWKIRIIIRNIVEITAYSIVFRIKEGFIKSSIWLSPHPQDSSLIVWILLNDWLMIGCSPCLLVMWWPPPFGHKDLKHPQEELAKDRWWLSDCLCQSCGTSHEGLSDTAWFHIQCSRLDSEKKEIR